MIVAVGLDLVEVERIKRAVERQPLKFQQRCFHPDELAELEGRLDVYPGLAARFAAKEAFAKCWRSSLKWTDVWVTKDGVRPLLMTSERLSQALDAERLVIHLSLTHTAKHAAAVVVLEHVESDIAAASDLGQAPEHLTRQTE
ncbi:MAG TPA: holo-ACP synthase [Trueperaceae bacterium]|nr:holo-ACP synthase [Trueperaceae bacterium]